MVSERRRKLAKTATAQVLILVLVEDGLGAIPATGYICYMWGLNPCFSGGWSRRSLKQEFYKQYNLVLILVLVEDGLGEHKVVLSEFLLKVS